MRFRRPSNRNSLRLFAAVACFALSEASLAALAFTEVSTLEGVNASWAHDMKDGIDEIDEAEAGGVAAGDYDQDGDIDLYIITGDAYENVLLNNNGAGGFTDETRGSGVEMLNVWSSGPVFADITGDGWVDLLVGSMHGGGYFVFENNKDGTFKDISADSKIVQQSGIQNDISSGLGDHDKDGDLDLFVGHHAFSGTSDRNHLWINDGSGVFSMGDAAADIDAWTVRDMTFAATFVDINDDGWQDLLVTADLNETEIYRNDGDGTFTRTTTALINDQFGMGSAPADYDNDGDIDWFVTSIHDFPDGGPVTRTGNRLYINDGSGVFSEQSETAGVRLGYWGWGACAADFDNDGWQDIFHVNGFHADIVSTNDYVADLSRLFMNDQDGTFTERSAETGLVDDGQGRGLVCFDYDGDGDIDIFVSNPGQNTELFRNDLAPNPGYLQVDVLAEEPGKTIAGAVIEIDTGSLTQVRHVTVGSNFESQNPLRQHFGLGGASIVDEVRVRWPSGAQTELQGVSINQVLEVAPPAGERVFDDGFESP
jgi:hypothetical protein